MGVDDLLGNFDYEDGKDEWVEKKADYRKLQKNELVNLGNENKTLNYNIGVRALHWGGKTAVLALSGFLNTKFFDKFNVKEDFPKTYDIIKSGLVPEIEKEIIIDLDCQFETQALGGTIGKLCKPIRDIIFVKKIPIPKQNIDYVGDEAVNVSKAAIAGTKLNIDNNIRNYATDSGPEVMLGVDSMSSYEQLCNDLFNIAYEDYMAKPKKGEVDFQKLFSFEKGINQKYWRVRNGWFEGALRDKRSHKGWQFDTYKMEVKPHAWLKKERASAESNDLDPALVDPYKTVWAPKTMFHLDFVLTIWNEKFVDSFGNTHIKKLWADALMRLSGNQRKVNTNDFQKRIDLTPNRRRLIFEIVEGLAPYITGEIVEDGQELKDEDLW